MSGGTAQRIENGVDAAAALLLAAAVLFCATKLGLPVLLGTGWAVFGFLVCFWLLGKIATRNSDFRLSDFAPAGFEADPPELLLDDVLTDSGEDPRVVRLFDRSAASQAAPPDATQALYDALIELRRKFIQQ
jgi:hypothetical protein